MIAWPAKDPGETLDFTWTVPLDEGDTVTSYSVTVSAGAITIEGDDRTGANITLWVSGGVDSELAQVDLTANTTNGRVFKEAAVIPIVDRASELLAQFRLRFADFVNTTDGQISYWLADAATTVGENWPEADRTTGRLLLAAHNIHLGTEAGQNAASGITSFKSGTFSASVSDSAASRTGFSATVYGRDYLDLARQFAGPRLAWTPPA